jgi:hypothetical protein
LDISEWGLSFHKDKEKKLMSMTVAKSIKEKLSSINHMLLYKERQLVSDEKFEPVLEIVRKRADLLKKVSIIVLVGILISFGFLSFFTEYETGIFEYLQLVILLLLFAFSFQHAQKIERVVSESEQLL